MKKIVMIICYFGEIPDYFPIWEYSALRNNTIDFLIYTDQKSLHSKANIKVVYISFEELKNKIQNKFDFKISLATPYKLCDYKPAYGYLFDKEIEKYDFWGYCDIDLVFGNLRNFFTEEVLDNNNIILNLGHLTLYKNTEQNKKLFMQSGGIYPYDVVYSSVENYAFDEMSGMHKIFRKNQIYPYMDIPVADIDKKYSRFKIDGMENYDMQYFYYDNGIFRKYFLESVDERKEEFCYLHFQKKHPKINIKKSQYSKFTINKDGFCEYCERDIDNYKFNMLITKNYEKKEKIKYLIYKMIDFIKSNNKKKIIWIKQKIG